MRELFQHYAKEIIKKLSMKKIVINLLTFCSAFPGLSRCDNVYFWQKLKLPIIMWYLHMNIPWWWLSPWPGRPFSHGGSGSCWPIRGPGGARWPIRGLCCLHPLITPWWLVSPEPPGGGQAQGYPAPCIVCQMKTSWNTEKNIEDENEGTVAVKKYRLQEQWKPFVLVRFSAWASLC